MEETTISLEFPPSRHETLCYSAAIWQGETSDCECDLCCLHFCSSWNHTEYNPHFLSLLKMIQLQTVYIQSSLCRSLLRMQSSWRVYKKQNMMLYLYELKLVQKWLTEESISPSVSLHSAEGSESSIWKPVSHSPSLLGIYPQWWTCLYVLPTGSFITSGIYFNFWEKFLMYTPCPKTKYLLISYANRQLKVKLMGLV